MLESLCGVPISHQGICTLSAEISVVSLSPHDHCILDAMEKRRQEAKRIINQDVVGGRLRSKV